jgi:5-bromo-4-chloroindolyl phosphate hydrolysis protein
MSKKDFQNLGNEIKDMVKNSINTGDYSKIGKEMGTTVNSALDMAFEEVRKALGSIQVETQQFKDKTALNQPNKTQKNAPQGTQVAYKPIKSLPKPNYFPHHPVGKVSGTLQTVFGSIGIGLFGAAVLGFGSIGAGPQVLAGLLILLTGSLFMEMKGTRAQKRFKRYRKYLSLFYGRNSCSIDELALYSGFSEKFLVKDIKKMISIGMFPQGHLNREKTLIMLNRERYNEYLVETKELKALQQKETNALNGKKLKAIGSNGNFEIDSVVEEGKVYIHEINEGKAAISDIEVSDKVNRMEDVIIKIIDYIEGHPEQLADVRRFMQYYLPTTIKLLNAYQEFERQPIQGENIKSGKSEIKEALDTINYAFESLFDNLFASASMDVSTDISVLHTMMAQEGLTEQDFNTTNTEGGNKE